MTTAAGIGIVGSLLLTPLIGEAGGGIALLLALLAALSVGLLLGLWRMSSRAEQRRAGALEWLVAPGEDEAQPRR